MSCGSSPPLDCIEPDFTVAGSKQWDRRLSNRERAEVLFGPPAEIFGRKVQVQNGPPSDPKWPLANYWPVYLSNFMVKSWDETLWYDQVSDYFAYYGFETRMIYFHKLDAEHLEVQKATSLIDALVYFCTVYEAERAIFRCNRRLHYGHRLNVLLGRSPQYFFNERSVRLVRDHRDAAETAETSLENALTPFGIVEFITRESKNSFLVEFACSANMIRALASQNSWKPEELKGQVQKQRFVEADVKDGIRWIIESQPGFLEQKPRPAVAQYFEDRVQPIVETRWKAYQLPLCGRQRADLKAQLKQMWKLKKRGVEYRNMSKGHKQRLFKKTCKELGYSLKSAKPAASMAFRNDVLESVNRFLRSRNIPPLTKSAMEENLKVRNAVISVIHEANEKGILNLK